MTQHDDDALRRALALCRQATEQQGASLADTLAELRSVIERLQSAHPTGGQPEPAAVPLPAVEPVITMDLAGYLSRWSPEAEQLFGYTEAEAIGQHVLLLYPLDGEDGEIVERLPEQGSVYMEVRRRRKSGEVFRTGLTLSLLRDEADAPVGLSARFTPVADQLSEDEKRRLHERITQDSDQGIMIIDADERIVSVNAAFTRITGYTAAEAIGQTPDLLRSGVHDANFRAEVFAAMHEIGPWHGEIIGRRKNGELFPQAVTINVAQNPQGEISHAFSIFSDISAHKEAEARMQRMANYDSVTGLPNRNLLHKLVGQALTSARRNHGHGALVVIDVNRFTAINDTLGFDVGDMLLNRLGQLFRQGLREVDVLARVDGGKFAVALFDLEKREHAGIVAQKLLASLAEPVEIGSHLLHVEACAGISVYPDDAEDASSLVRLADIALIRAKQHGKAAVLFYSPDMDERARQHLQLENELRRALAGHELELHYQPKVSLRSGRIVGAEALLRWRHPELGMVLPDGFIAVAEQTHLIQDLGAWVLDETCRQIRQWQDAGLQAPPIAVNLSARQFDAHLPARIQASLQRWNVASEHLRLEVTESVLVHGADMVIPIMEQLVAMGLSLALDDFGTGYSSLAYLKKFPIDTLKIDRAFVVGLPHEEHDCAIARAIVTMGQQLRQEIVAEGVETPQQMAFLRELGCDQLQGYLFSPALPAADFLRMVHEDRRLTLIA